MEHDKIWDTRKAKDLKHGFLLQAESCESLQTFVMMHSIGGGTGSGVGSYILELLHVSDPEA